MHEELLLGNVVWSSCEAVAVVVLAWSITSSILLHMYPFYRVAKMIICVI
jgi:hypothetical protein